MAGRPPKEGIDYSGWAVDIFDNDPKIDKLLDAQGADGFLIYFYLCQRAYGSKGYFYKWSYDDAATTARKIGGGVGSETVKQTVGLCLQIGLFDKRLFDRDRILTSRGIQKRYWQVAKDRTVKSVIEDYWLLSKEESAGVVFCTQNANYPPSKSNYQPPKFNYAQQKESKGKKSNFNDDYDDARVGAEEITPSWLFAQYFGKSPTPAEERQCSGWITTWDPDLLESVFYRACTADQKNLAYVGGILQNYRKRGINSMGDVAEDDMRHAAGR